MLGEQVSRLGKILVEIATDRTLAIEFHADAMQLFIDVLADLVNDGVIMDPIILLLMAILANGHKPFRSFLLSNAFLELLISFGTRAISAWLIILHWDDAAIDAVLVAKLLDCLLYDEAFNPSLLGLFVIASAQRFPDMVGCEVMMYSVQFGNPLAWIRTDDPSVYIETLTDLALSGPIIARICLGNADAQVITDAFGIIAMGYFDSDPNVYERGLISIFNLFATLCDSVDREDFDETNEPMKSAITEVMNLAIAGITERWSYEVKMALEKAAFSLSSMIGVDAFRQIFSIMPGELNVDV
jgi:hypothetical protein